MEKCCIADMEHVTCCAVSPTGGLLAIGTGGSIIRIWDTSRRVWVSTLSHPGRISALTFSPNGSRLVSAANPTALVNGKRTIVMWVREQGVFRKDCTFSSHSIDEQVHASDIVGLKFLPDPRELYIEKWSEPSSFDDISIIASASLHDVKLWKVSPDSEDNRTKVTCIETLTELGDVYTCLDVSKDGVLLFLGTSVGHVRVFKIVHRCKIQTERRINKKRKKKLDPDDLAKELILKPNVPVSERSIRAFNVLKMDVPQSIQRIECAIMPQTEGLWPKYTFFVVMNDTICQYDLKIFSSCADSHGLEFFKNIMLSYTHHETYMLNEVVKQVAGNSALRRSKKTSNGYVAKLTLQDWWIVCDRMGFSTGDEMLQRSVQKYELLVNCLASTTIECGELTTLQIHGMVDIITLGCSSGDLVFLSRFGLKLLARTRVHRGSVTDIGYFRAENENREMKEFIVSCSTDESILIQDMDEIAGMLSEDQVLDSLSNKDITRLTRPQTRHLEHLEQTLRRKNANLLKFKHILERKDEDLLAFHNEASFIAPTNVEVKVKSERVGPSYDNLRLLEDRCAAENNNKTGGEEVGETASCLIM